MEDNKTNQETKINDTGDRIEKVVNAFGETIEQVEKIFIKHSDDIDNTIKNTKFNIGSNIKKQIDTTVEPYLKSHLKLAIRDTIAKWSLFFGIIIACVFFAGKHIGNMEVVSSSKEIQTIASSSPGLVKQMLENGSIGQTLQTYCHDGSENLHMMNDGSVVCDMRVFLNRSGVPVSNGVQVTDNIFEYGTNWLKQFSPWLLLISSFFIFATVRYAVSLFCGNPYLRDLLVLPDHKKDE